MAMASSCFSSQFVTLFRGSFKCAVALQPFSLSLISGIDVTKEDRRHLNTMQLKTPRSSCPMVEEPKKQKWFGFKRIPLAGLVERKSIISFGINV